VPNAKQYSGRPASARYAIWENGSKAEEILAQVAHGNEDVFRFGQMLEKKS